MTAVTAYTTNMSDHDDAYWDARVKEAAENAAGFYYEKTKHDINLVLETLGFVRPQTDKVPQIEQDVTDLASKQRVTTHALKATNKDLRELTGRVSSLETTVYK